MNVFNKTKKKEQNELFSYLFKVIARALGKITRIQLLSVGCKRLMESIFTAKMNC